MPTFKERIQTIRSCLTDKPPLQSGTIRLPDDQYTAFYGKGEEARRIDLAHASDDQLKRMSETCDIATFGVNQENVHDDSYRKAGKLDSGDFAVKFDLIGSGLLDSIRTYLLDGHEKDIQIRAEIYKLNVYGKDSFFKPHKDTPRGNSMFGSLVVVYPTPHEGGSLMFRHRGNEWKFDSALLTREKDEPHLAYVAFYSDVEHEVTTVESGYRVSVTYNLYFVNTVRPVRVLQQDAKETALITVLKQALGDPAFLPEGGNLAFDLQHRYPIDTGLTTWLTDDKITTLRSLANRLKGSDALLMQACRTLSLDVSVRMVVEDGNETDDQSESVFIMMKQLVVMDDGPYDDDPLWAYLRSNGGELISSVLLPNNRVKEPDIIVHWVTEITPANSYDTHYLAYGNEPSIGYTYASFCLLVDVPEAAKRAVVTSEGVEEGDSYGAHVKSDEDIE